MNPVVGTPNQKFCQNLPFPLVATGCDGATTTEWSLVEVPAGANVVISSDATPNTDVTSDQLGDHTFEICCTYDLGPPITTPVEGPFVDCPLGVPAGGVFVVTITGCPGAVDYDWIITGNVVSTVNVQNQTTITTTPTPGGTVGITYVCIFEDGSTSQGECETTLYDPALEYVDEDTEALCLDFVECGTQCFCTKITINAVDCGADNCVSDTIGVIPKLCPDTAPIEPEICDDLEVVPVIGTKLATADIEYDDIFDCGDCDPIRVPRPDRPVFIWNDVCQCPGWTVAGDAAMACDCNVGSPWCFSGGGTFTATGPPASVDIAVIYGHNIESGQITTSPPAFGGTVEVNACEDAAKIGGFTRPIVIPLDGITTTPTVSMNISGTAIGGGDICIDYIMFGQKLFLPDDLLPASFQNPLDGTDCEFEIKESECGILSRVTRQKLISWSLEFECLEYEWLKEVWRPYLRYLCAGNPVMFQPSRNNCPDDLLFGFIDGQNAGSTQSENLCGFYDVSLAVRGYVNQPQAKAVA